MKSVFMEETHEVDFCVIGGGMAGLSAALTAARHGASVALIHDRPVLGGNASSECRVHICGADRHNSIINMRETGILEEIRLENLYRNPDRVYPIWDAVLYEKALREPNLTLLLNCSCLDAAMDGDVIRSVTGWQLTTQSRHRVHARIFADCSGDSVLAPLSGAEFRRGREARQEYNESIAPPVQDTRTMGMTCLFQAREHDGPRRFEPPSMAHRYESCEQLPYGADGHRWWRMGYWWVELGGEYDEIHDTERLRDELLKITFGVWDHIKNHCSRRSEAENWALEWIQFLPAKRESRRYLGAHVLSQNDIETGGPFEDIVAYGGWTMDDHHPAGFNAVRIGSPATRYHPAPSPYGIPYRCLYSRNIRNLMFAGRNASCTHAAMSSTRVMGTGCSMGQAVGTAAAMAAARRGDPADMLDDIEELQQRLIQDDAYLPGIPQIFSGLTARAKLTSSRGDPEPVRDGTNRPVGDNTHRWRCRPGDWIACRFERPAGVDSATLLLDSGLDRNIAMSYHQKDDQLTSPPGVLPRRFRIEGLVNGDWTPLQTVENNRRRLCRLRVNRGLEGIRFILDDTWGAADSGVYAFYMDSH